MSTPKVSIIIPTYHDWKRLAICLDGLEKQTFPTEDFEILVVNNDPKDQVPDNFYLPQNCVLLNEGKPGSYSARNAALKLVKGEIIGFTDSDCIPDKDWIKNAVDFLNNNQKYSRIAGNIVLFYQSNKLTFAELYEKRYAFKQDFAASLGIGITGNMFTYKHVFDKVGHFNDNLLSSGDNEWWLRANKEGYLISFGENIIINHPARHEMSELMKKAKRLAGHIGDNKLKAIVRFLKYSIPPLNALIPKYGLSLKEAFIVFFIRYYLNINRYLEELSISFGKKANRE